MVHLTIETTNSAFSPDAGFEIARILRDLANKIETQGMPHYNHMLSLYDINGNKVGVATNIDTDIIESD